MNDQSQTLPSIPPNSSLSNGLFSEIYFSTLVPRKFCPLFDRVSSGKRKWESCYSPLKPRRTPSHFLDTGNSSIPTLMRGRPYYLSVVRPHKILYIQDFLLHLIPCPGFLFHPWIISAGDHGTYREASNNRPIEPNAFNASNNHLDHRCFRVPLAASAVAPPFVPGFYANSSSRISIVAPFSSLSISVSPSYPDLTLDI